jgi:hypothetical protein
MKNVAHPMDRTTNWCIGGCWFTLAKKLLMQSPLFRMMDLIFPSLDIYGEGGALVAITFFFFTTPPPRRKQ